MPPVRWKLTVVALFLQVVFYTDAQFGQEISVDGWKPIIGTRKPNFFEPFGPRNGDFYKYDFSTPGPTILPATGGPSRQPFHRGSPKPTFLSGRKIPHQKQFHHPDPFFALPADSRGPHIPLGAVIHTRPGHIGHIKQHVTTGKPYIPVSTTKRNLNPARVQSSTISYRDDIFTAAATSGAYNNLYKQGQSNIRTRETLDLGLPGNNHYTINQPHAHIEFNGFGVAPTSQSFYEQYNNPPVQTYVFRKPPQNNEINYQVNDEFSKNLIPPVQIYKNKELERPKLPENVNLQVPPPFQYTQQKLNEPIQVQVTKEKLHEFHNNIPENYHGQYLQFDFSATRKPTEAPKPVYEVTESLQWQEPTRRRKPQRRPPPDTPVFLPTPYKPDIQGVQPTSPTQSEVSTIFTKLSKLQKEKEFTTPDPSSYTVKEVSTHYPIFGKPTFVDTSKEISNEITTHHEEIPTTTREPQRIRPHRRRRPDRRTTTTTTTEATEVIQEDDVETERPVRMRRPNRYRTTTVSSSEETSKTSRGRNRYRNTELNYEPVRRRPRPVTRVETTTLPNNHKDEEEYSQESSKYQSDEAAVSASEKSEEIEDSPKEDVEELPERHVTESPTEIEYETIRPFIIITTTEKAPGHIDIPENEVDEVTSIAEETTTTTAMPTTTLHRIKSRPLKFDNSHRPRFSVKDYRQKLNLQTSTTTSQPHRSTESVKIRLPSRIRRPLITTVNEEETTEPIRSKFVPKEPRHGGIPESGIITEKNVKSINTRLRPFGRHKSTTPATTTTQKVSIKPNLFSRKRPSMLSLRNKILTKQKNNTEATTERITTETSEVRETTEYDHEAEESSSFHATEESLEPETTTVADLSKIDPYFYSQRVSDLTSSAKNDYNTPGVFKSVSPTSRRIPNYFTIATDDPILPIEAFFSNIKDKVRDKDS